MRQGTFYLFLLIVTAVCFVSCKKEYNTENKTNDITTSNTSKGGPETKYNTFKGPQVKVGDGHARTFATISHSGIPTEIGVIFSEKALTGLPDINTIFPLKFHQKAIEATPFEHVALGLSAHGHPLPPSGAIGPHMDVRFFMMTNEERLAIPRPLRPGFPAGGGFDVYPPPGYFPSDYVANAAVVQIGRHWAKNIFLAGQTVDQTMILGTWNGEFTFVNPIVTLTTLASGTSYSIDYSQPQHFPEHGYYPTKYNIYADNKGSHYVTLSHFVSR